MPSSPSKFLLGKKIIPVGGFNALRKKTKINMQAFAMGLFTFFCFIFVHNAFNEEFWYNFRIIIIYNNNCSF